MLLNLDQLQKQLDKDEFQEDGSMTAFWVVNNQFQKFIDSKFTSDYDSQMTDTNGTESDVQDDSSRSGNDTDADDADIRPIYDEEPMAEVQLTAECNIFAIGQQPTVQPKFIVEGTSINVQKEQSLDLSAEVHQAAETVTTSNELDVLFGPLFDEYFNGENQVVLKSSAVTTTDASNKRQQQPDSTSSTSTLATTVTANGNFDL
ncbi:hypothetical protein Tco_1082666 [Tanacetum coccineum]|uniref:Uncharacterized protein n=1 Tax=Tanacetum coccineum TaxID=301880 RepID=A0ABQ5I290_9ASTR